MYNRNRRKQQELMNQAYYADKLNRYKKRQQEMENQQKAVKTVKNVKNISKLGNKAQNIGNKAVNVGNKLANSKFAPISKIGNVSKNAGEKLISGGTKFNAGKDLIANKVKDKIASKVAEKGATELGKKAATLGAQKAGEALATKAGTTLATNAIGSAAAGGATAGAGTALAAAAGPVGAALMAGKMVYDLVKSAKKKRDMKAIARAEQANAESLANKKQQQAGLAQGMNENQANMQDQMAQLQNNIDSGITQNPIQNTTPMEQVQEEVPNLQQPEVVNEEQNGGFLNKLGGIVNDGLKLGLVNSVKNVVPGEVQTLNQAIPETGNNLVDATRETLLPQDGGNSIKQSLMSKLGFGGVPTGGAASTSTVPDRINEYMDYLKSQNVPQNVIQGVPQGLNGGNRDIADWISQYNNGAGRKNPINIPSTEEEIARARSGEFNTFSPEKDEMVKESILAKLGNGAKDLIAGYNDNVNSSFKEGDMYNNFNGGQVENQETDQTNDGVLRADASADKKHNIMNKIGEAIGTGQRILARPTVQGLIAAGISKANGNDLGSAAEYGFNWGRQKAQSDYYRNKLNPNAKPDLFGGYDEKDYSAELNAQEKERNYQQKLKEYNDKLEQDKRDFGFEKEKFKADQDYKKQALAIRAMQAKNGRSYGNNDDDYLLEDLEDDYKTDLNNLEASDDYGYTEEKGKGLFGREVTKRVPITKEQRIKEITQQYRLKRKAIRKGYANVQIPGSDKYVTIPASKIDEALSSGGKLI